MNKFNKALVLILVMTILIALCGCSKNDKTTTDETDQPTAPAIPTSTTEVSPSPEDLPPLEIEEPDVTEDTTVYASGEVVISFDFVKQTGSASNQFAVWIETLDGKLVKTLYATDWTVKGGYKTRPDSLFLWAQRSNIERMTEEQIDAISSATPDTGSQTFKWDLTNDEGDPVVPGEYSFVVEGTMRWKNFVVYYGNITIGDTPSTVIAERADVYQASDDYEELTEDSTENSMIGPVAAVFTPLAN